MLDFSELTNDQLVELAAALAQEALRRSPATAAAFQEALLTEKQRAAAAARGAAAARARSAQEAEEIGRRAEHAHQREVLRQLRRDVLAVFVRLAARITGRAVDSITLVWHADRYGRGPQLHLNAGTTGRDAEWHLVSYDPRAEDMRTSPGLKHKTAELLRWAREASAAAQALGEIAVVVQGAEL